MVCTTTLILFMCELLSSSLHAVHIGHKRLILLYIGIAYDCFMHLIQEELQRVKFEWNSHRIRPIRNTECPPGHPNELYFMPEILGITWVSY